MAQLRDRPELNILFVCMASPSEADSFRKRERSPHPFACDPQRVLYGAFGLQQGKFRQLVNLTTLSRGVAASARGHLPYNDRQDAKMLAGSFIIDENAEVVFEHRAKHAADNAEVAEILRALGHAEP